MKKTLTLLLSSLFLFMGVGCDQKTNVIKINEVTHSVFYAPLYLADALGYFEEEGIKIELTNGGGADNTMAAVLSGGADIGFCGPEAALYVLVGGSTDVPKVIGQLTKRDGSFLVSRNNEPNFKWSDLKGKEVLAGRKGGVPAMTFEYVTHLNGIDKDVNFNYDVAFNLMTSAFEAGTADYCTMFEPVASEYQASGKGYIVASVGMESGEIPYTCFLAKESWLKNHESETNGFLRAVTKATKYVMEADTTEIASYLVRYFESTSLASLRTSVESYKKIDAWMSDLSMQEDSFNRLQDVIDYAGELTRRVKIEELVDNSYSEKAYEAVYGK